MEDAAAGPNCRGKSPWTPLRGRKEDGVRQDSSGSNRVYWFSTHATRVSKAKRGVWTTWWWESWLPPSPLRCRLSKHTNPPSSPPLGMSCHFPRLRSNKWPSSLGGRNHWNCSSAPRFFLFLGKIEASCFTFWRNSRQQKWRRGRLWKNYRPTFRTSPSSNRRRVAITSLYSCTVNP